MDPVSQNNFNVKSADPALARVIARIESSGNPHTIRFEPRLYAQYDAVPGLLLPSVHASIVACNGGVSDATANAIAATSYGAYQILGANLYALNWHGSVVTFQDSPNIQDQYFAAFLNVKGINFTLHDLLTSSEAMDKFVRRYNGIGAIDAYANKIRSAAAAMGLA